MPGENVSLIVYMGERGTGKSEIAVERFLTFPRGFWLDLGLASTFYQDQKTNRQRLFIPTAPDLKSAKHYLAKGLPTHFSYRSKSLFETLELLSFFSKNCPGVALFLDEGQKLLNAFNSVIEFNEFVDNGRMQTQNLVLCVHRITEIPTKVRGEVTELYYMGQLPRPAEIEYYFHEWLPEDNAPDNDKAKLKGLLQSNPKFVPFPLRIR